MTGNNYSCGSEPPVGVPLDGETVKLLREGDIVSLVANIMGWPPGFGRPMPGDELEARPTHPGQTCPVEIRPVGDADWWPGGGWGCSHFAFVRRPEPKSAGEPTYAIGERLQHTGSPLGRWHPDDVWVVVDTFGPALTLTNEKTGETRSGIGRSLWRVADAPKAQPEPLTIAAIRERAGAVRAEDLKAGDTVLVEMEVKRDGFDADGDVVCRHNGMENYCRPGQIVAHYPAPCLPEPLKVGDRIWRRQSPGGRSRVLKAIIHVDGVDYAVFEPFNLDAADYLVARHLADYVRAE